MKKLLLLILVCFFVPRGTFAVTTNRMDNVLVTSTLQFTGGTPGAGKLATSDASGFFSWQTPAAVTGPFAITNGPNFFTTASTNTFNALTRVRNSFFQVTNTVSGANAVIDMMPGGWDDRGASILLYSSNATSSSMRTVLSGFNVNGSHQTTLAHNDIYRLKIIGNQMELMPNAGDTLLLGNASGLTTVLAGGFTSVGTATVSNLVLSSTGAKLAGLNPVQIVTNITGGSGITVTGGGTRAYTISSSVDGNAVSNIVSTVPWMSVSGQGTAVLTLSTNSTKISTGNLGTRFDSGSLGFSNSLNFAQVQTNTFTATGVTTNDFAVVRLPSDLPSDSRWEVRITSANTVSVTRQALSSPTSVYTNSFSILDLGL